MTIEEIERLRTAAYAAQDYLLGAICDLALTGEFSSDEHLQLTRLQAARVVRMSREDAIRGCIRASEAVR